jgi:hypothetical protein
VLKRGWAMWAASAGPAALAVLAGAGPVAATKPKTEGCEERVWLLELL